MRWWLGLVLACGTALVACEPEVPSTEDGAKLFAAMCARCHMLDGRSTPELKASLGTPDMTLPAWQAAHPPDVIKATVVHGSKSKKMPAFGAKAFTPRQLDALAAHVKGLGVTTP